MRRNVTSGRRLPLCVCLGALLGLLLVADRTYAKRGCSAFGHSCFGGHGKRFDPRAQENSPGSNGGLIGDRNHLGQEYQGARLNNEALVQERPLFGTRRPGYQKYDPYTLLVGQWLASHWRLHRQDLQANGN